MPKHRVMKRQHGDLCHEFDTTDEAGVKEAEERFRELTGSGFTAAKDEGDGKQTLVRKFDPEEDLVFYPPLQGG